MERLTQNSRPLFRLVALCLRRPVSTLTLTFTLLLMGGVSFFHLPIEFMPTLSVPVLRVVTEYPGFPASEVERLVTIPLENSLSAVKGLRGMESVTKEEISSITLRFDWKVNLRSVTVDAREKIDSAYPYLPEGIRKPLVHTEDLNGEAVLVLGVVPATGRTLAGITPLVRGELSSRLLSVAGVSNLRVVGTAEPELRVEGSKEALKECGLTLQDLAAAIQDTVFESSLGTIVESGWEYLLEATAGTRTPEEVGRIPLKPKTDKSSNRTGALKVSDLARVTLAEKAPSSFFHANGEERIGIFLHKMPEAGSLQVARAVRAQLPHINSLFQREFRVEVLLDPTERITESLRSLVTSMGLGVVAVFMVLFIALKRVGPSIILSLSIPLSVLGVFLFLYLGKLSLNMVSLTGIALGIGMIVDNSVIVWETLYRYQAKRHRDIAERVREVFPSLFASTLTTGLVFLPILFLPGVWGVLFQELALTLTFLLVLSLLSAVFCVPVLYALAGKKGMEQPKTRRPHPLHAPYRDYLYLSFRKPFLPFLLLLLVILAGSASYLALPQRVLPEEQTNRTHLTLTFPAGTPLNHTARQTQDLEKRLLSLPSVRDVVAEGGYETKSLRHKGEGERNRWTARLQVLLSDPEIGAKQVNSFLLSLPSEARFRKEPPSDGIRRLLGNDSIFQLRISGPSRDQVLSRMEAFFRNESVSCPFQAWSPDTERNLPIRNFQVEESVAVYHGVTPRMVQEALGLSLRGKTVATFPYRGEELDILIRLEEQAKEGVSSVYIPAPGGQIPAALVGTVTLGLTFPELRRVDRKPAVTWTLLPKPGRETEAERVLETFSREVQNEHTGLTATLLSRGAVKEQGAGILKVFLFALLLMYLVLGAQFESFRLPLLLLLSFPLAASGSFLFLAIFGFSLNLHSFLGILVLLGTIINSVILLADAYAGKGADGIVEETIRHLRPLFATLNTTLVAMAPLLGNGKGNSAANTALSLGGGLLVGTLGVLLIYPPLYYRVIAKGLTKE